MASIDWTGRELKGWTVGNYLGGGGNGVVYQANRTDQEGAIKILKQDLWTGKRYQRFKDEIEGMKRCDGIRGVVPLLDSNAPEKPSIDNPPWIVMGLAQRLTDALGKNAALGQIVGACAEIAEALVAIHERGLAHRDIKPENLFRYQERWAVGDLGLVDYEGKEPITAEGEKLGPIYYIAPEMLNNSSTADGKPADVFSFAKTLWVLATGQRYPLPGEMRIDYPANCLSTYVAHPKAKYLDRLIESATRNDPRLRPKMDEVTKELSWFLAPASEVTSVIDLSEITRRLTTAREPALRAEQRRNQFIKEAQELLEQLKLRLNPLNAAICHAAGVGSTPVYFKPPTMKLAYHPRMGSLSLLWGNGHWFVLETPGHYPVRYYCGLTVEVLEDGTARVAGAHWVYSEKLYDEILWNRIVTARLGSAELEHDLVNLLNGLIENLPFALQHYANRVEHTP